MTSILIYLLPAIMDMILPAVFFMAQVHAAAQGESPSAVANFITTWAVVYMVSSLLLGRIVTRRNASSMIILSCMVTAALSIAFSMTSNFRFMYMLMGLEGVGFALFFVPFQVFMKAVGENKQRSINSSVGLYTFSWSLGFAAGPFIAAVMWKYLGWQWSHLVFAGAAMCVLALFWVLKHAASSSSSSSPTAEPQVPASPSSFSPNPESRAPSPEPGEYASMPDLAWMGWVFSGLGCLAARMVYGLFPSGAATYEISTIHQGLTLFTLSATQALIGLALGRFRWWMYRPLPIFAAGLCGFVGLCVFAFSRSTISFYLAAACFGVYSGMFFYYLVFHAIVHPDKSSRYVAVDEATVGLTSLLGPLLGGMVATGYTLRTSYLLTAGMLLVAILAQTGVHARIARPTHACARECTADG